MFQVRIWYLKYEVQSGKMNFGQAVDAVSDNPLSSSFFLLACMFWVRIWYLKYDVQSGRTSFGHAVSSNPLSSSPFSYLLCFESVSGTSDMRCRAGRWTLVKQWTQWVIFSFPFFLFSCVLTRKWDSRLNSEGPSRLYAVFECGLIWVLSRRCLCT